MRVLFCHFLIVYIITAAPALLTERQKQIQQYWGKDVNVTRAEAIFDDEAQKLGITTDEYFEGCLEDLEQMVLSQKEQDDIRKELSSPSLLGSLKLNSSGDILENLSIGAPKTYQALVKRQDIFEKYLARMDEDSRIFLQNVEKVIIDAIVNIPQSKTGSNLLENPLQLFMQFGKTIRRIKSEYDLLPQSSKDLLERNFCIRSTLRIIADNDRMRGLLDLLKAGGL